MKAKKVKSKKVKPSHKLSAKSNNSPNDITALIMKDHEPLKKLILTLKDSKISILKKRPAYKEFKRALTVHARAEEESLYVHMKEEAEGSDLRKEGFEGDAEHEIADTLFKEIDYIGTNNDKWIAKVKVLAELVDHHIKEEETEFFKKIRKEFTTNERVEIGKEYSRLFSQFSDDENDATDEDEDEKRTPNQPAEVWA